MGIEIADSIAMPRVINALSARMPPASSQQDLDEMRRIEKEKKRQLLDLLKLFLEIYGTYVIFFLLSKRQAILPE